MVAVCCLDDEGVHVLAELGMIAAAAPGGLEEGDLLALQARQIALRAATTGHAGAAELATTAEALSGQDQTRAMTPSATKAAIDAAIAAVPGGITSVRVANTTGPNQGQGSILVRTTYALARSVSGGTVTVTLVETEHYEEDDDP